MSKLNLLYVHHATMGYGRYGVHLAEELGKLGVEAYDHLPGLDDEKQAHLNLGYNSGVADTICWISVPTHARGWYKGQRPVISTMWEAYKLPESFRETLHEFDTVVVPSRHNLELFSQYHDNVRYVPLGVDPLQWHFVERRDPGTTFDFLIGGSGSRKGTDLAWKAFRKLWPTQGSWGDGPVPRLIMKNPKGEDFYGDRVEVVAGRISAEAEVALYASAHCYLAPSRGEGFGLQPLQAMAQGLPTILTNAHGHESFAYLGYPLDWKPAKSDYFIYGDAGQWWEPNFDQLCMYMKWVYDNYDKARAAAWKTAHFIGEHWTWEHTARKFLAAIGDPGGDFEGREVYRPSMKLYTTILDVDWAADIAGVSYQFRKGQVYHEPADVKRILFEASLLDPACLTDDDHGLLEHQARTIPAYSARHAYCDLCGQKLGSGVTKADEILNGNCE